MEAAAVAKDTGAKKAIRALIKRSNQCLRA